jgi:hypothetical protein
MLRYYHYVILARLAGRYVEPVYFPAVQSNMGKGTGLARYTDKHADWTIITRMMVLICVEPHIN